MAPARTDRTSRRGLLEGRTVVITAAAGSGIGGALARRCLLEGARIVISDAHERRVGETADALGEEFGTTRSPCAATSPTRTTCRRCTRPPSRTWATSTSG